MNIRDLITVKVRSTPAALPPNVELRAMEGAGPAVPSTSQAGQEVTVPVFITPESLATFPVASSVVTLTWKVLGVIFPALAHALWIPAILALILGSFLYFYSLKPNATRKEQSIAILVALVNSLFLMASALGIDATGQAVTAGGTIDGATPTPTTTP